MHFVMFPWLAFGHMLPFLELSKSIARKGHRVTFISTPRNIDRLPKLPPGLSTLITFKKIPLPKFVHLPENAEATTDISSHEEMTNLKKAVDGMECEVKGFLKKTLPDWIIYDFCHHWLPKIVHELGMCGALFSIVTAWFQCMCGPAKMLVDGSDHRSRPEDFTVAPTWVPFPTTVAYRLHETEWFLGAVQDDDSGFTDSYRVGNAKLGSDAIVIRQCPEFGGEWLNLLQELNGKPVIPLGLMPPTEDNREEGDENQAWSEIISSWLDTKSKRSVLYVALGSEVTLSQEQLVELALGLELSRVPFLWVLREPKPGQLPEGFEERIKGRGMVWKAWAPQLKILSHDSVGGFLTHCGWSSLIEGITFGQPLIMLPFIVDSGLSARVFAEKEVGIELPRNEVDGRFNRDSVAETVRFVMKEEGGVSLREKAKEMSRLFGDVNLQNRYMDTAIQFLENYRHSSRN